MRKKPRLIPCKIDAVTVRRRGQYLVDSLSGETLYELYRGVLGQGTYGTVYRARDARDGTILACKEVDAANAPKEAALYAYFEELDVGPASIRLLVDGSEFSYIIMEYFEWNLQEFMNTKQPSQAEKMSIEGQILSRLRVMLAHGIVCSDQKPPNALVKRVGDGVKAVLTDFDDKFCCSVVTSKNACELAKCSPDVYSEFALLAVIDAFVIQLHLYDFQFASRARQADASSLLFSSVVHGAASRFVTARTRARTLASTLARHFGHYTGRALTERTNPAAAVLRREIFEELELFNRQEMLTKPDWVVDEVATRIKQLEEREPSWMRHMRSLYLQAREVVHDVEATVREALAEASAPSEATLRQLEDGDRLSLILDDYEIGKEHVAKLVGALHRMPNLEVLHVGRDNIDESGAREIAAVLRHLPNLKHLALSDTDIGRGAVAIAAALPSSVTHLDLSNNHLTDADIVSVASKLQDKKLDYLSLNGNDLTDVGEIALANLLFRSETLERIRLKDRDIDKADLNRMISWDRTDPTKLETAYMAMREAAPHP